MNVEEGYSDDLIEREHACHEGVGTEESDVRHLQVPVPGNGGSRTIV